VSDFVGSAARSWVTVRSPQVGAIASALEASGAKVTRTPDGGIDVVGPGPVVIGELAAHLGATLHELSPRQGSLEEAFLQVTADAVEYQGRADPDHEAGR
jgi:ABC-2 type transport system ATP-binding protein